MTTIVANLECMAADQRITSGGPVCHSRKLFRIGASVFGYCGDAYLAQHVIRWLASQRHPAQLYKLIPESHRDDIDVLELSPEGLALWNGWGVRMDLLDTSYAVGSGAMSALQALRLGKSPLEAVALTFPLDEASGGNAEIETLVLKPKRKR